MHVGHTLEQVDLQKQRGIEGKQIIRHFLTFNTGIFSHACTYACAVMTVPPNKNQKKTHTHKKQKKIACTCSSVQQLIGWYCVVVLRKP